MAQQVRPKFPDGLIDVKVIFYPPNKRRRDMDNMLASIKAALDAVSEAWGVDDSRFRLTLEVACVVKGGSVLLEVQ